MPWSVDRSAKCGKSKPWAVIKDDDGSVVGCHPTKKAAQAQQRALYASEEKAMNDEPEMVEEKDVLMDDRYVPWGVTTFAALETARQADDAAQQVRDLAADFEALTRNILGDENVTDKPAALKALADEFGALVAEPEPEPMPEPEMKAVPPTLLARLGQAVKAWLAADAMPEPEPQRAQFVVWKEAGGGYRWLATYSNKFRDRDYPQPEILSEAAHLDFVKAIDAGEWPMPALWLWHVPGAAVGQADWLSYADGFALASGLFDKAHSAVAERLEAFPEPLAVSHGMPVKEIERDAADPTVITRYRTREISVLPAWAAANALTGFDIQEVREMAIPQDKKSFLLAAGLTEESVAAIEADLEGKAKEAADAGLEYKAADETQPPEVTQDKDEPVVDTPAEETVPPAPAPVAVLTAADIAAAVREVMQPIEERLASLETLKERIDALNKSEDERVAEQLAATPAASLADLIRGAMGAEQRAIGHKEARVDGRSSLVKAGPVETEPNDTPMLTAVPWINNMLTAPRQQ